MHAGSVELVLNPVTGHVSPQYHVVYDETFSKVSHMRDETIPPTWDEMCKNSVKSATSDASDLAELWFKHMTVTSEDPVTDPFSDDSGSRTLNSEGVANKPNLTTDSEGDIKVAADAIARKSLPNLASMTGRKGVSFADVQYGITKSFSPETNEGDQLKMPKLFNILQSVFALLRKDTGVLECKGSGEISPQKL